MYPFIWTGGKLVLFHLGGKQGVYISEKYAIRNYLLKNSKIHVLPLAYMSHLFCLVLEIKL